MTLLIKQMMRLQVERRYLVQYPTLLSLQLVVTLLKKQRKFYKLKRTDLKNW